MTKSRKNNNTRRGRRNRGGGDSDSAKISVWKDLAILGVIPDRRLSVGELKAVRDMALLGMPGNAHGSLDSYVEIFSSSLISVGISPNDSVDMLKLVAGTGQALHWTEIPDFDPAAENSAERRQMQNSGGRFMAMYDTAQALRRKISTAESKDDKKVAAFRSQFSGGF